MDWKDVVSKVAPWIGTALGGPLGGIAVSAISDVFGLSDSTEATLKNAISGATPDQLLALKKADQDFSARMQELGFKNTEELARLAVENTKDARAMQVATRSKVPAILAVMITLGFFGILTGLLVGELRTADNQALLIMLGALGASWGAVVNYYFGSSSDSSRKTELMTPSAAHAPAKKA